MEGVFIERMNLLKDEIIKILNNAKFPAHFSSYIQEKFPIDYRKKFKKPFHQDFSENPMIELENQERIFESLAQLISLKEFYLAKEIPIKHFYKSIYDLNYRINRFYQNNGAYGLTDSDLKWLSPLYKAEIFDLASLRFQISEFSYQEIERQTYQYMPLSQEWKKKFPEGTPIITIHILKDTDFRPEKIDDSLFLARNFFAQYFPEHNYEYFVCRSWLLYQPIENLLGDQSNIVSFAKRFQIIAQNQNTKQALDRIYGTSDFKKIQRMSKKSSLAQKAYKNLDYLGVAAGIIPK